MWFRVTMIVLGCLAATPLWPQTKAGSDRSQKASGVSAAPTKVVSFRNDVLPIFKTSCTMCHQGDAPMGALSLTPDVAYQSLVDVEASQGDKMRVVARQPDRSYLYAKVSGQNARVKGNGWGMPLGQQLPPSEADLIRRWIEQGARDN